MTPGFNPTPSQNAPPPHQLNHRSPPSSYRCVDRALVALFGIGFLALGFAAWIEILLCFSFSGQVCSDTKGNVMALLTVGNPAVGCFLLVASLWPCLNTADPLFIFAMLASVVDLVCVLGIEIVALWGLVRGRYRYYYSHEPLNPPVMVIAIVLFVFAYWATLDRVHEGEETGDSTDSGEDSACMV